MVQQHFTNLTNAMRTSNLAKATTAANAILGHYGIGVPANTNVATRISWASRLKELKNLKIGNRSMFNLNSLRNSNALNKMIKK